MEPELEITGEAADGEQAIKAWSSQHPDVIVMDMRMPGISGLDAAEAILQREPGQAIVLFSACLEDADRARASKIGIRACLDKLNFEQLSEVVLRSG